MPRQEHSRQVAIAGATGLVGQELLRQLLDSSLYGAVYAVGRRAPPVPGQKLRAIVSDLGAIPPLPHIDAAYCCLGTTIRKAGSQAAFRAVDFDMVLRFASAAKHAGAKQFLVVSSLGADTASSVFYNRIKGEMEQALIALKFHSLQIYRPSLLVGERIETRLTEHVGIALLSAITPLMIGPARKFRPVAAAAVARAMAAADSKPGVIIIESEEILRLAG